MAQVAFKAVTKIFGKALTEAARLRAEGRDKPSIRAATGCTFALADVSLTIARGETFVVMGLSGSGKSTLVRLVNRLIAPTSGDVLVGGHSVTAMDARALMRLRRFQVSMVFQGFALFPHKTALQNVAYGLEVRGEDKAHARAKAMDWIARVGLDGYEDAHPAELSGGMQQRVGLARALATDPEILLMDEPFSALDPLIRADMQDQLLALQKQLGKTVLFITHDLGEALRLGDRIAILRDGQVVQCGTGHEILSAPADAHVSAFVRALERTRAVTATILKPK